MGAIYRSFLSLRGFGVDAAKFFVWVGLNLWQEVTVVISFHKPAAGFILFFFFCGKLSGECLVFLLILLKGLVWNLEINLWDKVSEKFTVPTYF